ncbi:MAG: MXAN_6521/LA_1396 family lipoprotein [Leptospira sp.]|nr:MXAN_6521/LA_1396 family lipoprotein [Leptospira sp.]
MTKIQFIKTQNDLLLFSVQLVLLLFFFGNCTVKYIRPDSSFEENLKSMKRISIISHPDNKLAEEEKKMLAEMAKNYLSHHKEYIVYGTPKKFQGNCLTLSPKVQSLVSLKMTEETKPSKISLSLNGTVTDCKSNRQIWDGLVESNYSFDLSENASLVKTYTEKYGQKIAEKVTPYFLIIKALLDELDGPTLTEDEQMEKIEVESK